LTTIKTLEKLCASTLSFQLPATTRPSGRGQRINLIAQSGRVLLWSAEGFQPRTTLRAFDKGWGTHALGKEE